MVVILWESVDLSLVLWMLLVPNNDCEDYEKIENENVVGTETYPTKKW